MKIQLLSDLHFEQMRYPTAFIDALDPADVDVLVLAGDITYLNYFDQVAPQIQAFLDKYKHIIYITGNHEYYTSSPSQVSAVSKRLRKEFGERLWLFDEPGSCEIDGQHFLCGTGWYKDDPENVIYQDMMSDGRYIEGHVPWVYEQHEMFIRLLEGNLYKESIVVSHHAPSYHSINEKYVGSELNRFFVCDVENLIIERQPKLMLHGHIHDATDHKIGNTRVVANPFGYYREQGKNGFNDKLVIEI